MEDHSPLVIAIAAEQAGKRLAQGIKLPPIRRGAFGLELNEDAAAILRIAYPARKALGLEPIDEARDGRRREAGVEGDFLPLKAVQADR